MQWRNKFERKRAIQRRPLMIEQRSDNENLRQTDIKKQVQMST
jgi:hypothetical protein